MFPTLARLTGWNAAATSAVPEGIPTFRQSLPALEAELRRSRRYDHPLAVLALSPAAPGPSAVLVPLDGNGNGSGGHAAPALPPHVEFFLLGSLLQDTMRETDVVTYAAEHHLFAVFLAECAAEQALLAAGRVEEIYRERTSAGLRVGAAEFPAQGLTVADLFDVALAGWRASGEARPAAPRLGEVSHG